METVDTLGEVILVIVIAALVLAAIAGALCRLGPPIWAKSLRGGHRVAASFSDKGTAA